MATPCHTPIRFDPLCNFPISQQTSREDHIFPLASARVAGGAVHPLLAQPAAVSRRRGFYDSKSLKKGIDFGF
jgi:hypothetical protein